MRSLAEFTADILEHRGAIVEATESGLEALLPTDVAAALELSEHVRLSFAPAGGGDVLLSYEGDVFRNMSRLVDEGCRFAVATFPRSDVSPEKMERAIRESIAFNNAVFRMGHAEESPVSYLLACLKYAAVSDEKQEGTITLLIGEPNLSVKSVDGLDVLSDAAEGSADGLEGRWFERFLRPLSRVPADHVREALSDFVKSLDRRMNRDIRRVQDYYHSLIQEARLAGQKASGGEERVRAESRIRAIDTELRWKIEDAVSRYSLDVSIEPVSFVRVETVAPVFWIEVRRRKGARMFPIPFNPLIGAIDAPSCESCFAARRAYSVCDERLHIVCEKCLAACGRCGREYCKACHSGRCPRCRL